jgi:hypothetical protein
MARATRANPNEQRAYSEIVPTPLYPLYGFVKVSGKLCYVEYLGEGPGNPNYEVMAPRGFHFDGERVHTLLCGDLKDLDDRTSMYNLEPCTEECE